MHGYQYGNGGYDENGMPQASMPGTDGLFAMGQDGMAIGMANGQSLEQIVNLNANVDANVMRRQSMPQQYGGASQVGFDDHARRVSNMMEFSGGSPAGAMAGYEFDPSLNLEPDSTMSGPVTPAHISNRQNHIRRSSTTDLAVSTSFPSATQSYNGMLGPNSAFTSPAHQSSTLDMGMTSPYIDPNVGLQMDYPAEQSGMINSMLSDGAVARAYGPPQYDQSMLQTSLAPPAQSQSSQISPRDPGGGSAMSTQYGRIGTSASRQLSRSQSMHVSDNSGEKAQSNTPSTNRSSGQTPNMQQQQSHGGGFAAQPQYPQPGSAQDRGMHLKPENYDGINGPVPVDLNNSNPNNQGFAWEPREGGWPSTMVGKPHTQTPSYKGAYSATGFDMLGVLMRVATRPNPEINIGSVDLSCAFVVCDAEKDDFPIVYCSDNFERLTGYTKHMILGRNCRFLQSPDGNVTAGVRRKYVDDDSVLYLKNMINLRREAQISLINYRRGGQPFMNLLTMIPISWDTEQVKFFVGFQVDLVEQPNAVTNKNPDGSYSINYQRGMAMPAYMMNAPEATVKAELGQTVPRDDVSTILSTIGSGESEYAKRMWDKVLLENTDDVVHVLSLKGLFQWVSPSAIRVLEYEPSELIGTALSSVCHPSDIVPVTRELKDTSSGAAVNVVFRIRRKNSGYMWFEGHGSLHTEQGKGRKSIIMVGRERPVYALSKEDIASAGGIGESELWSKMSTSGMFLFVSSNVRQLLDRQPEELVGTSVQSLMRSESKQDFGRMLEFARTGKKASIKHEMINRRGQVLSAHTTLYPGDAKEGQKPTFLLAQTRLIKFSRSTPSIRPGMYNKQDRTSDESQVSGASSMTQSKLAPALPTTSTNGNAITYAGQDGLAIGHQDDSLASEDNLFDELKTTKSSSWQYEIRQLEKKNRMLAEEVQSLIASKKKRKRRKGAGTQQKDCANCHTRVTPEWRRGPSGQRDLCNSCGLRWAKLNGRVSPRGGSSQPSAGSEGASKASASPLHITTSADRSSAPSGVKNESPNNASAMTTAAGISSPRASKAAEIHSSSMEGASGVPTKIDEGDEPD